MPQSSHPNAPDTQLSDSSKTKPSRQDNPLLRYLYLLIALGGLTYAGLGFVSLSEATRNESWPRIEGQILSNSVKEYERKKSDGSPLTTYQASVEYQYEIGGVSYQSSALSLHPAERTLKGVAQTELEPYPVGTKVMVYYNPDDPNQAVLRSSDTVGAFQAISAGLCIGLVCLVLFFISKRRLSD
ncbi:MAG: DUF3592 domain-containing protein [Cohaesibacter sp.]|nr:DUF3592 domain-containing protein [Cohaesibacter sp.]MCV6602182.1 DUF3592 domain-containing protein [Cohaesibacter sp.]